MTLISEASKLIQGLMKLNNINRTQLAAKMGVSKSHVSRLLDGNRNMRLSTLEGIMHALDVEPHIVYINKRDEPD